MEKLALAQHYKTIGTVKCGNKELPILDIKIMSDERWQELAYQNAISNYKKEFGHAPVNTDEALQWQRNKVAQIMEKVGM